MNKTPKKEDRNYWKIFLIICASIVFYGLVMHFGIVLSVLGILFRVLLPIILGLAIAFIINIPLRFYEKTVFRKLNRKKAWKKLKRPVCLALSWLTVLVIFVIIFALILPDLLKAAESFFAELPGYMDRLDQTVSNLIDRYHLPLDKNWISIDWSTISSKAIQLLHNQGMQITNTSIEILRGFISGITNLLLGIVFSCYVLASKESLARLCKGALYSHFKKETAQKILSVCSLSNKAFSGFVSGQCTEAVLIGVLCYIGMLIFFHDYPHILMVSCLIAVTALVPIFGAIAGAVLSTFLLLLFSPLQALLFLIFILILQQIESNLIYPKIMGKSVGLPGIWVLAAVTVGGNLGGVVGMILSVPVISVLFTLYERWISKRLAERNISKKMLVLDQEETAPTPGQAHIDFEHPDRVFFEEDDFDKADWDHEDWEQWEQEKASLAEEKDADATSKDEDQKNRF